MSHVVTIKNVKNTRGREGQGFTCSVYIDGRRVCEAEDWGDGGQVFFRGISDADHEILKAAGTAHIEANPQRYDFMVDEHGKLKQPVYSEIAAFAVEPLVAQFFHDKQVKGWCKNKIVLKMPGSAEGSYATINQPYNPALDAQILAKNPGAEIVNKRFL